MTISFLFGLLSIFCPTRSEAGSSHSIIVAKKQKDEAPTAFWPKISIKKASFTTLP